tara:strand:+ start:145 stop:534 length:390 start_codon:yes stop_codon:yes gene_type:complete
MYNVITLIGNLGADAEIKTRDNGDKFAILNLATHKKIRGEKMTEWHKVIVWDSMIADTISKYTSKGSKILLQGRLTYNLWEKDGQKTKTAEIHLDKFESKMELLDSKSDGPPSVSQEKKEDTSLDNIPF